MADRTLINPNGANVTVTDFRLGIDASSKRLDYFNESVEFQLSGTVVKGDVLIRVAPTAAGTPLCAAQAGIAPSGWQVVGVAEKSGVAGDVISVTIRGFTFVNVGAGTAAAGDVAVISATVAGRADVVAAGTGLAATTVVGTVLGHLLGAKNAANLAPVWFEHL